jgi:hypothetical protein
MCLDLYDKHDRAAFARDALFVQDACNLRAIARLLVAAADHAANNGRKQETDAAVVLIVNKLESLVHSELGDIYCNAYEACHELAGDKII